MTKPWRKAMANVLRMLKNSGARRTKLGRPRTDVDTQRGKTLEGRWNTLEWRWVKSKSCVARWNSLAQQSHNCGTRWGKTGNGCRDAGTLCCMFGLRTHSVAASMLRGQSETGGFVGPLRTGSAIVGKNFPTRQYHNRALVVGTNAVMQPSYDGASSGEKTCTDKRYPCRGSVPTRDGDER